MAYDNQTLFGNSTLSVHSYVEADIYFDSLVANNGIGLYLNCVGETQIVGSSGPYPWTPDGYSVMVAVNASDPTILDFVLKYATIDTGEVFTLASGQYQITTTPGGKLRLQIDGADSISVLFDGEIFLGPVAISPVTVKEGFCGFHFLPYQDEFMMTVDNFVAYSTGSGDGYIDIISNIGVSALQGIVPFTVAFTDQSSGVATSWHWDFGDGTTSTVQNPSHEFTTPGIYKVMLTVTDGFTYDSDVVTIVAVRHLIGSDAIGHWIKAGTQFFAIDVVDNVVNVYDSAFVKQGTITGYDGNFNNATFLFYDGTYIYVCDSGNNRIQWYTTAGQYVSGFSVAGTPFGCCTNGVYVYITDTQNDRVMVYTMTGQYVESFGAPGSSQGQFQNPQGISVDNHFLYVMDSGNGRVQIFTFDYEVYEVDYGFNRPTTCRPDGMLLFVYDEVTNTNRAVEMTRNIPLLQQQVDSVVLIHDIHGR